MSQLYRPLRDPDVRVYDQRALLIENLQRLRVLLFTGLPPVGPPRVLHPFHWNGPPLAPRHSPPNQADDEESAACAERLLVLRNDCAPVQDALPNPADRGQKMHIIMNISL